MNANKPSFLGAVLKHVVSTPNEGDDADAYQREVVEPTKRWRALWEQETELSLAEKREVIAQLVRIFEVKRVEKSEQQDRLRELAALFGEEVVS